MRLSPIIDCFDGLAVSHTLSTSPDAEMARSMPKGAISALGPCEKPLIHSDCSCRYRWLGWISVCDEAGLTRSMSKKGYGPDDSAMEGFFGRLKTEMLHGRDWSGVTIEKFVREMDAYIGWCNAKRIKRSLGSMSPLDYRRNLGLTA